ncbi:family 1 glycosylhydrolase [Lyngbya sp. CCY1209]|uniref:Ycf66 family protein n=1 Tax=Lyngbya sp. CCY1209 TaxID=2886103 RepID=UPI002D203743|nr:family 1 glycosylhydrolase [Lyngbya sp. CCY1209]MEB3887204.1 family 1 glycosylhydrolase [Lyngbya sp. CCY1209]
MVSYQFPKDLIWGRATASYQIEGAIGEGGRKPSVWDTFSAACGGVLNGDTGAGTCAHFHRYEDDIKLMGDRDIKHYQSSRIRRYNVRSRNMLSAWELKMLAYILAIAVGLGSFALYMAAFFFPEVHRKSDWLWSGVGLFYALILWACAGRFTGAILLGQMSSVALLGWLGWQTLTLRREVTPLQLQTPIPDGVKRRVSSILGGGAKSPPLTPPQPAETPEPAATAEPETVAEPAIAESIPREVAETPAPATEPQPPATVSEAREVEVLNPAIAPTEGEIAQTEGTVDESAAEAETPAPEAVTAPDEPGTPDVPETPETPTVAEEDTTVAVVEEAQPEEDAAVAVVEEAQPEEDTTVAVVEEAQPEEDAAVAVVEEAQPEEDAAEPDKTPGGFGQILSNLKGLFAQKTPTEPETPPTPPAPPEPPVSAGETPSPSDWDEGDDEWQTEPIATEAVSSEATETPPPADTLGAIAASEGTARNISNVEASEEAEPPADILGAIADAEETPQPPPATDVSAVETEAEERQGEIVESVVSATPETEAEPAETPERSPFETMMATEASPSAVEEVLETKSPAEPEESPSSEEPPNTAIDRSPEAEPDPPAEVSESVKSEEGNVSEPKPEAETRATSDAAPDSEEATAEDEIPPALQRPKRPKK